jgi:hypothetical protein
MKKSQSFHIITKGELTQKGDFTGIDTYNNAVFISKKTKLFDNVDCISEDSPLFCFAKVDEVFNKDTEDRKLHFLKCYYADFDLIKILTSITDDFVVELDDSVKQVDNFMFVKLILEEYNFYKEKKQFLATNKFGFNRATNELNYNLPFLLLSQNCFQFKLNLDKYINFYGYDSLMLNDEGYYCNEFEEDEILYNIENRNYKNAFKITLFPLFKSLKQLYKLLEKPAEKPKIKIITKDKLKQLDTSSIDYFNNYYELNEGIFQYELEHSLDFIERLQSELKSLYVYTIKPIINLDDDYTDKLFIQNINQDLINIIENLELKNICNLIVLPPDFIHLQILEEVDYYLNPPEENGYNTFDGWVELGNQEMNKWDEETGGSWRIENDFD